MKSDNTVGALECRHFFSGAAVYREGTIIASPTPVGLAFKVPTGVRDKLLDGRKAIPLRYFPSSPIKRDYVLFPDGEISSHDATRLILGDQLPN